MDLTEADYIKKRLQEYTEQLHKKKIIMTQIIKMVVWGGLTEEKLKAK